jgi:hypothetical protein
VVGALSSGEGLIAQVRDAEDSHAPVDKRRLVVEPEFAQVLKVLAREGNTLSAIVRQAWEGEPLQTIVRNNPLRATAAHIGIVAHITRDELLRHLTATELANGFANRFLLIGVERSKLLPFGGALDGEQFAEIRDTVRLALRFAQGHRAITFDDDARERWGEIYEKLSFMRPGLAGAATARAEAHTVRLALNYALLDLSERICLEHLEAARGVALQRRFGRLDLRRLARRSDRRRHLGPRQRASRWSESHRGARSLQPQQKGARDRSSSFGVGGGRATPARPSRRWSRKTRRNVDARACGRMITASRWPFVSNSATPHAKR